MGARQLSSSLQRQEEDSQGSPKLQAGQAGGSVAWHHHHCDTRERRTRPELRLVPAGAGRDRGLDHERPHDSASSLQGGGKGRLKVGGAHTVPISTLMGVNSVCHTVQAH